LLVCTTFLDSSRFRMAARRGWTTARGPFERGVRMQRSFRKVLTRAALAVAVPVLALAILPGVASAASQSVNLTFSGSHSQTDILSAIAICDECAPDLFFTDPTGVLQTWGFGARGQIQAQASWDAPAPVNAQYTQSNLRHGQTLDLS